jgi:hypothetical protein
MDPKPTPRNITFRGCLPEGDGGDPDLNKLKNRVDEYDGWLPVSFSSVLNLTWPKAIERKHRSKWSDPDTHQVARYEGLPISIEGYLFDAKRSGKESCNCKKDDPELHDFHVWLMGSKDDDRTASIVVEPTPPVRSEHSGWDLKAIRTVAKNKDRVRISGWLMLDPEHPDQIGKTRGTIWEIHPVMEIEVKEGGAWVKLDAMNWPRDAFAWSSALDPADEESDMLEAEDEDGDEF